MIPRNEWGCTKTLILKEVFFSKNIFFIEQLKQIQKSNTRFLLLSDDMMTGFVQTVVVHGAGVEGAQYNTVITGSLKTMWRLELKYDSGESIN